MQPQVWDNIKRHIPYLAPIDKFNVLSFTESNTEQLDD